MIGQSIFNKFSFKNLPERLVNRHLRVSGAVRVLGYTNAYLVTDTINTRIHINHFLSGLYTEYQNPITVVSDFYNPEGKLIASKKSTIAPEGFAILNVRELLKSTPVQFGTVVCHVVADAYLKSFFRGRGISAIGSYFFVTWSENEHAISCSHSIEAYKGSYFEIPSWASMFVKPSGEFGDPWVSNKGISPNGLEAITILANNPGRNNANISFELKSNDTVIHKTSIRLAPLGTKLLQIPNKDFESSTHPITVHFSEMATGNSKPYVFLKYKNAPGHVAHHL